MGQVTTNFTFEGFDDPALGLNAIGDIKGESITASLLRPYYNKRLSSTASYDSRSNELVLKVSTGEDPLTLRLDFNPASSEMKRQLLSFANGGSANITLKSVFRSLEFGV